MDDQERRALELYKICVEEEHYFLSEHQKRIAFYTGLLSAVLTITIGGFLKATAWYHHGMLVLGGLLFAAISKIAKAGTGRLYQRFLETVTTRAKFEQDLGFSQQRGQGKGGWVKTEPYSPARHLNSRTDDKYKASNDWVDAHLKKKDNYHGISSTLFLVAFWIGIILMVIATVLACMKDNESALKLLNQTVSYILNIVKNIYKWL